MVAVSAYIKTAQVRVEKGSSLVYSRVAGVGVRKSIWLNSTCSFPWIPTNGLVHGNRNETRFKKTLSDFSLERMKILDLGSKIEYLCFLGPLQKLLYLWCGEGWAERWYRCAGKGHHLKQPWWDMCKQIGTHRKTVIRDEHRNKESLRGEMTDDRSEEMSPSAPISVRQNYSRCPWSFLKTHTVFQLIQISFLPWTR